jgi:predicted amidohydrolase
MRVAAFQFDVRTGAVPENLAAVERGLRAAAAQEIALVVLPEMWPTSFVADMHAERWLDETRAALARVAELARELALVVCGSALGERAGERPANRLHVFAHGALAASHDKVHLFSPTAEDESFSAGLEPPPTVDTPAGRLAGVVCYDLRFPELTRMAFCAGAEVLAVCAQWPAPRAGHWRALCAGRAVENQCFVVGANRTGNALIGRRRLELVFAGGSLVVAPDGRVLAEGGGGEELVTAEVELAEARRMRARVPGAKDRRPEVYELWERTPGRLQTPFERL